MSDAPRLSAVLAEGAARLRRVAADPRREALRLWADLAGAEPADAWLQRDRVVSEAERARFEAAVARRAAGEPLAYVTGCVGFRRLVLRADRRALIPRPETEGLVERVLAVAPTGVAVDVGTGSGCIALSLAQEGRYRAVVAIDRSADALALAAENAARTGQTIALVRGDLLEPIGGPVDVVVSNPPYLTDAEYAALDPGVRAWEPAAALASGPDGLDATTRLLDDARRVVRPGGWLALELDCTRAGEVARRAAALGWRDPAVFEDLYGRERYLLARRSETP